MNYEHEKDNKLLASSLRGNGVAPADVETILRLTNARQTWLELAECARKFEALDYEDRKHLIHTYFNPERFGKAVSEAYFFISRYRTEPTVGKEVLPLYASCSAVANAKFNGTHQHLSAIAAALCELLEYDAEQPDPRVLTVYLKDAKGFKEGYYSYNMETYALEQIGEEE